MAVSGPAKPKTMEAHFATFTIPLDGNAVSIFTDPLAISTKVQSQFVNHLNKERFIGENWDFLAKVQEIYKKGEPTAADQMELYNNFIKKGSPGELNFGDTELKDYREKAQTGKLTKEDLMSLTEKVWNKLIYINLNDTDYKKINTSDYTAIRDNGDVLKRQIAICDACVLLKQCIDLQKALLKNSSSALNPLGAYARFRTGVEGRIKVMEKSLKDMKDSLGHVATLSNDDVIRRVWNAEEDMRVSATILGKFKSTDANETRMCAEVVSTFTHHADAVKLLEKDQKINIDNTVVAEQVAGNKLESRVKSINPEVNPTPWKMQVEVMDVAEETVTRSRSNSPR